MVAVLGTAALALALAGCAAPTAPGRSTGTTTTTTAAPVTGSWSSAQLPSAHGFISTSCTSAASCVAMAGGSAYTYNGGNWSSGEKVDPYTYADYVSCVSADFCMTVDSLPGISPEGYQGGFAFTYTSGTWSPGVKVDARASLSSVSCVSASFCMAVDGGQYVYEYKKGRWSAPVAVGSGSNLSSVSCASASQCVAVSNGRIERFSDGKWTAGPELDPSNFDIALSCPSPVFCAAFGDNGYAYVLREGRWSPGRQLGSGFDEFPAVSCSSVSFCMAVDEGDVYTWEGGHWSTGDKVDPFAFASISCASDDFCAGGDTVTGTVFIFSPATTGAPVSTLAPQPCVTADLSLSASQGTVTGGTAATNYMSTAVTDYHLTNTGARDCTLFGYPGVAVLDAQGNVVQRPAARQQGPAGTEPVAPATVMLIPGGEASFLVAETDSVGTNTDCPVFPFAGTTLQVIPPGETVPIHQPYGGIACDLAVGPVQPASGSPPVPGLIADCPQPAPEGLTPSARPSSVVFACADAGLGAQGLSWTSWTGSGATGSGAVYEHDCTPSCAASTTFDTYPASITLSGLENTAVGPLFSILTASFRNTGPNGQKTEQFDLPLPPE